MQRRYQELHLHDAILRRYDKKVSFYFMMMSSDIDPVHQSSSICDRLSAHRIAYLFLWFNRVLAISEQAKHPMQRLHGVVGSDLILLILYR